MFASARTALRNFAAALALAAVVTPSLALAQAQPSLPSYARPAPVHEQITGSVSHFDGKYGLFVNDDRGFVDTVQLRDGTIINPTGLRLIEGMRVTVTGYTSGKTFVALQIDTPYTMTTAVPVAPAYAYGPGYYGGYYGYPGYYAAYPWYYPVAAFGLGVAFGAASYYWGPRYYGYYGGYYGYRGGYYGYRGGYYGGYGYKGGPYGGGYYGYKGGYSSGYRGSYGSVSRGFSGGMAHGFSGGHR
jgi:hypothetical protein